METTPPPRRKRKGKSLLKRSRPPVETSKNEIYILKSHNYKVLSSIGVDSRVLSPTPTILDTGAGPNFVSEKILPPEWRDFEIPRKDVTPVRSATGNPLRIKGAVLLYVQIGSYKVRIRFVVASNLSVPCILGCNFIDCHVEAILPKEQRLTLRDESSTSILRSSIRDVEQQYSEQEQYSSPRKVRSTTSD